MEGAEEKHAMRWAAEEEEHYKSKNSLCAQEMSVHPLLQGGQLCLPHRFSKAQLEAFVALCGTVFPSLPLEKASAANTHLSPAHLHALEVYFLLSAAHANLSLQAAGRLTKLLKKNQLRLLHLGLWLLTSRVGTLAVGGKKALTGTFPFISEFASLPPNQRERFLFSLSRSHFRLKQELFRLFTAYIPWFVFTSTDRRGSNPTFAALHYSVGEHEETLVLNLRGETPPESHPQFLKEENLPQLPSLRKENSEIPKSLPTKESHLASHVIDADLAGIHLAAQLASHGVSILDDVSHLKKFRRKESPADVEMGLQCDAVVLGSGPGGAVVASKLAQAGHRVLILEKGQYFPGAQLSQLEGPSMYAMYEESGCVITDDSRIVLLAGATVGGGSTINWSASFKTPRHVREEWARSHHLDLFESHSYERAMEAVCSRLGVQSEVDHENFQNGVLRAGCRALGYHVDNIPRNSPPYHQCGFCGLGCKQGKKQGAMLTWLEDAAAAGAVLLASCRAEEVLWAQNWKGRRQVLGVVAEVANKSKRTRIYVSTGVVVVACGALWTPAILRQSGLHNRSIGKNLHIHPVQLVWGHFEEGKGAAGESFRGALMTAYSNVAGNWDTTGYGALVQCVASQPGIISLALPWVSGLDFKERMLKFARTATFIVLTRDQGGGQVSADKDGRLCVRYQVCNADKKSLKDGAEKALRILVAAGACKVGTCNSDGETFMPVGASTTDFDAYLARVRAKSFRSLSTLTVSAHQMGSCRMGVHPSVSAVKPSGETWEVEGLFVADTSVFPTATGVNPMITAQSIAYCIADSILLYLQHHHKH